MNAEPVDHALIWFSYALGDLAAARSYLDAHTRSRIVAFRANRAARNALTAALVLAEIDPPGTDDLEGLRETLPSSWGAVHAQAIVTRLSRFGSAIAYPGPGRAVTPKEAVAAVRDASAVLALVQQGFERRGVPTRNLAPR
jgi:HEPN domain-containing protein